MRIVGIVLVLALAAAAGLALWLRLMPIDAARFHVDPAAPGFAPGANWAVFCPPDGSREAGLVDDPEKWLAALRDIALSRPRTEVLAGSPEEGRITFVTRSRVFAFPDFTTAAALPAGEGLFRICLYGRARFGDYDWGVNAARVRVWAQTLFGLPEPPALG